MTADDSIVVLPARGRQLPLDALGQPTRITYMWASDQIEVVLEASAGATTLVRITTPVGVIDILGEVSFVGRTMRIDRAHIDGPGSGRLGRRGLNAIGAKLLAVADVEQIIVQGSHRTTGRNPGRPPEAIRYPR